MTYHSSDTTQCKNLFVLKKIHASNRNPNSTSQENARDTTLPWRVGVWRWTRDRWMQVSILGEGQGKYSTKNKIEWDPPA